MKIQYGLMIVAGMLAVSSAASAEELTGRISNVNLNDGSVRVLRSDNNDYLTLSVKDRSQLSSLRNGSMVAFEAYQASGGTWEGSTFRPLSASSVASDSGSSSNTQGTNRAMSGNTTSAGFSAGSNRSSDASSATNSGSSGVNSSTGVSATSPSLS